MGDLITIPYKPRPFQLKVHKARERFNVFVCHRRFGKTVLCINELIKGAVECKLVNPRFGYIAPLHKQAKAVAWDYLKMYTAVIPGVKHNESELRADLPNGARIQLFGADNPDAARGIYFDGVVLDEYAQMSPRMWSEVVRPALTDRKGWAIFIGTPMGHNAFYDIYKYAIDSKEWFAALFKASDTKIIAQTELDMARDTMGEDEYEQEFNCSFTAAVKGAYYGKIIEQYADHITDIKWEPNHPVDTWWDLGVADSTVIWFSQTINGEHRFIDYYEASGEGLQHYAGVLNGKEYTYGEHNAPHDIQVRELGSGMSRIETAKNFGINFNTVPNQKIADGIQAVRTILPKCYFDKDKCDQGVESLRQYRKAWDDKRQVYRDKPLHDWTSHAADAFRYFAVGIKERKVDTGSWDTPSGSGWQSN